MFSHVNDSVCQKYSSICVVYLYTVKCVCVCVDAKVPFFIGPPAPPAVALLSISGSASCLGFTPVARGVFL